MESQEPHVTNKIYADGGHGTPPFCFPFPHSHHGCGDGFGLGGGAFGLVALLALLNGRGFGIGANGVCDGNGKVLSAIETQQILSQLGLNATQIQQAQTLIVAEINRSQQALAAQVDRNKDLTVAGFSTVNTNISNLNTEVLKGNYATLVAIQADGDKTRALILAERERDHERRHREQELQILQLAQANATNATKIEITNTANATALATAKSESDRLFFANLFHGLGEQIAVGRATNVTKQFGTGNVAVPSNSNSSVNQ